MHAFNSPQPQTQAQAQPQPHIQAQSQPHAKLQPQTGLRALNTTAALPRVTQKAQKTYADIAKGPTEANSQRATPKATPKPLYIPERLKEPKDQLKPIRAFFKDPKDLEDTPEAILSRITSPQQAQAIRGLKKLSKRLLLVYPKTLEARAFL